MTLHPRLTRAAVALVKRFETFQPQAEPTPGNGWSIGYGHTRSAREGARISEADAEALLIYDLDVAAKAVERALFAPVSQSQFEALTALCFNLGEPAFLRSSALARVNAGAELDAADEIERWRRAELGAGAQVVDALVRRRAAEKAHFLGLPEGEATWPSAQLRPLAGPGGESTAPSSASQAAACATLTAANGVQARLRRLIPEDARDDRQDDSRAAEGPPPSETAPTPTAFDVSVAPPDSPSQPTVAWEPTPPPFDAPPEVVHIAPAPEPAAEPHHESERVVAPAPAVERAEPAARPRPESMDASPILRPLDPRLPYAAVGVLGVVLFAVAAVMIVSGRAGLLDLGLGAAGVLLAALALYGLLGGATRSEPVRSGSLTGQPATGQPVAAAGPFPNDPPDTK